MSEDKAFKLYAECCEKLDRIQDVIKELIDSGHALDESGAYFLNLAINIVQNYDALPEESKHLMLELEDKVQAGEITLEEAFDMSPSFEVTDTGMKMNLDNKKRPLLN